jgi:hypothetical protein
MTGGGGDGTASSSKWLEEEGTLQHLLTNSKIVVKNDWRRWGDCTASSSRGM